MNKLSCVLLLAVALSLASAQSVRINEFMADNDTIASPAGNKADWVELYNTTSSPVSLAGMYLSDNATNAAKWVFPTGTTIAANGYLVVWAYDTTFAGALYASWSLSKDGEHLRLSAANLSVVDSVTFGLQPKNRSAARIPNGTGTFSSNCLPTLGMQNTCVTTSLAAGSASDRSDPHAFGLTRAGAGAGRFAARFTLERASTVHLSVLDARGREVSVLWSGHLAAGGHTRVFDPGMLPGGTYWFRLRAGGTESIRPAVILR
jgi:Lamin Tail Domain